MIGRIGSDVVLGITVASSAHTAERIEQQIADVFADLRTSGGWSWRWTLVHKGLFSFPSNQAGGKDPPGFY